VNKNGTLQSSMQAIDSIAPEFVITFASMNSLEAIVH
jgi:hypothetical protein